MGNSHSQRHYIEWLRQQPIKPEAHGHISTYTNRGCRCDACRLANRVYMQGYRKRAREAVN